MPLVIKTTGFEQYLDAAGGAYIKALIMGDHGVGKTPSAACWPMPIIADCEDGLMSVANRAIPYAPIKNSRDMEALLEHLRLECMKPAEKRKYKTLIIDTIDTYQRKLIQERLKAERKENLSGWADWGYLDAKMQQLIERMLNLPMNIVVNMHVKDVKDEDGEDSILVRKARLKGDIKDAIFQDFDLVGQMESSYVAEKGERVLKRQIRWQSEPKFPALRDRSGKLPRFTDVDFTDQDYFRIFEAITAGVDDLPESADLETVAVEGDGEEIAEPTTGGPLDSPTIPRKPPAKKTAAKKAAPKTPLKAVPDQGVESSGDFDENPGSATPVAEDPWKPPADEPSLSEQIAQDEAAEAVVTEQLGGVTVEVDGVEVKGEIVESETAGTGEAVNAETGGEVTKPGQPLPKAKGARTCGEQPESMVGKHDPFPGCGKQLSAENATRNQIAMLRTKTYLCDECFATWPPK